MDTAPAPSPASDLLTLAMQKSLVCKFRVEGPAGQTAVKLSLGSEEYQVTWSSPVSPEISLPSAIDQVAQSALSYLARMAVVRAEPMVSTDPV